MYFSLRDVGRAISLLTVAASLGAQNAPGPDVLLLANGEKLIGHLKSATGNVVVFKSDTAGQVTVPWAKITELHSAEKFAAIPKNAIFKHAVDASKVAQGTVDEKDKTLQVTPAPAATPQNVPLAEVGSLLDEKDFQHALHRQGIFQGWTGGVNLGLALTEATTTTVNQTASFNLSRTDPSENWLDVRNRTNLSFFELYSNTHAPYSPNALVSVFQANAVHDFYISQRTYAFAGASFEHTSPQGLDLMQAYGGGLGEVLIKNDTTIFEVRVGLGYMHQSFIDPLLNKNILGSRFGEDFSKTFKNGVTIVEQAGIRPAWTYSRAFFAGGNATVTVPVYRRLGVSLGLVETFLNNPPPYFKKNNFQATFGLHYSLK